MSKFLESCDTAVAVSGEIKVRRDTADFSVVELRLGGHEE